MEQESITSQEQHARDMYTAYCEATDFKNFKGDPLPTADEFFTDDTKKRQADAWRAVAAKFCPRAGAEVWATPATGLSFGTAFEAMKNGHAVRRAAWHPDITMRIQMPDECGKITEPYLYVTDSESGAGSPRFLVATEMLAEDWSIVD